MTFEQLLVKYLYQHKQVSLQGFGTVTLKSSVPDPEMIHKNRQIPIEGISFDYNMKALTDEPFVLFYSQQRGKIKPLAISDIESHLQLAKQLMNIGKPYEVEGLGIFAMDKNSNVVLHPGNYAIIADNAHQPGRLKERTEQQEKTEAEASGSGLSTNVRKGLLVAGILLLIAVAGWFIWSKFVSTTPETGGAGSTVDSLQQQNTVTAIQDTLVQQTAPAPVAADTTQWRAYFRTFAGKDRLNTMLRLYEKYHPIVETTTDSTDFKLYVIIKSPIADTASKVDSLSKVFLRPVSLEKINQ